MPAFRAASVSFITMKPDRCPGDIRLTDLTTSSLLAQIRQFVQPVCRTRRKGGRDQHSAFQAIQCTCQSMVLTYLMYEDDQLLSNLDLISWAIKPEKVMVRIIFESMCKRNWQ